MVSCQHLASADLLPCGFLQGGCAIFVGNAISISTAPTTSTETLLIILALRFSSSSFIFSLCFSICSLFAGQIFLFPHSFPSSLSIFLSITLRPLSFGRLLPAAPRPSSASGQCQVCSCPDWGLQGCGAAFSKGVGLTRIRATAQDKSACLAAGGCSFTTRQRNSPPTWSPLPCLPLWLLLSASLITSPIPHPASCCTSCRFQPCWPSFAPLQDYSIPTMPAAKRAGKGDPALWGAPGHYVCHGAPPAKGREPELRYLCLPPFIYSTGLLQSTQVRWSSCSSQMGEEKHFL